MEIAGWIKVFTTEIIYIMQLLLPSIVKNEKKKKEEKDKPSNIFSFWKH